ncbi:hypothetical protein [Pseudotabrizicola sp. L79]|uniref:hypothetical protein n=1 Tax=Pseudotabrizicola sp. L79 TaxID=3118402 RepID=UPI002F939474
MIAALQAAGFPGVEAEGEVIHARLWSASVEFSATPEAGGWRLAVQWPVRASAAQVDGWNAANPTARMDVHQGETRVSMWLAEGDAAAVQHWAAVAEAAVATLIGWRRNQRAPGEGM